MAEFRIDKELLDQVQKLAAEENRSMDDVVTSVLWQFVLSRSFQQSGTPDIDVTPTTKNPLLLIAQGAEALGDLATENNVSERSREILRTEYPEYLMRRVTHPNTLDDDE